jgi:hypothetical protein
MGVRSVYTASVAPRSRVACARAAVVRVAVANDDTPDTAKEAISTGSELCKVSMAPGYPTRGQRTMQTMHPRQVVSWDRLIGFVCARAMSVPESTRSEEY